MEFNLTLPYDNEIEAKDKNIIQEFIINNISEYENNSSKLTELIIEATTSLSAGKSRADFITEQGFFKNLLYSITGQNRKIRGEIDYNYAIVKNASVRMIEYLAGQNKITYEGLIYLNNKLNNIEKDLEEELIIISAFVLIIVIVAGILIYNMNIENQDKTVNAEFESAFALYSQIPQDRLSDPNVVIEITTRFQKVYREAKGKNLKLRAAYSLGSIYYDIGNFSESSKYFKEVADSRGFYLQESAIYNLANSQIELTNYTEAANTLDNFIKAYPNSYLNPQATLTLSDIYIKQNDKTKSINVLRNWQNNNDTNNQYFSIFSETINLIENNVY